MNPHIEFTDRELGLISLAIIKCDILSSWGQLPKPWCNDHDEDETTWLLTKIGKLRDDL